MIAGRPRKKKLAGAQIARLCRIAPSVISRNKKPEVGKLKANQENSYYIDDEINKTFLESYGVDIETLRFSAADGRLMESFDDMGKPVVQMVPATGDDEFDPQEKVRQDTRLKKINADLKSLEYAKRMDVMVDTETLQRMFGRFYDCISNDLLPMAESVADLLKMLADSEENPEKAIEKELNDRIRIILENAKEAAKDILPNDGIVRYILAEPDNGFEIGGEE